MLTLITLAGGYWGTKRHQIAKVNYYAEKINLYHVSNPVKAKEYASKLLAYYRKLADENKIVNVVSEWFIENPPLQIIKRLDHQINRELTQDTIIYLSREAQLYEIYDKYQGKSSFKSLIQKKLKKIDDAFEVITLASGNNPIVLVNYQEQRFVIRFLRMNVAEEAKGHSPRIIRELMNGIPQIAKPYLLEHVAEDNIEVTFIEYSEYYANGNLEDRFQNLRIQKQKQYISPADFSKILLNYAVKLVNFYIVINQQNIWYTDLKPSNILLNDEDELVISDIKGLVFSTEKMVRSSSTSTSQQYFQSSVFVKNQINLERLQCHTLGTTLYQLACGQLPEQEENVPGQWSNIYDFLLPVFKGPKGSFLKGLITDLVSEMTMPMSNILNDLNAQLLAHDDLNNTISLDEYIIDLSPSTKAQSLFK
ncbi:protein kinase domain-containing protein [Legionella maioricensis]|uniref:Protein kinase domain-containing protein n=1 Tax=Legionella maioricensis TaxID=2896528 RepID=A0A9X2CXN4_9GAMM|nr:hypothetical protein [Legionella maioricensis]MCL9682619.1 hypothetical protein [Legionella maioricensis]MCL9687334.1 hypothetical protein [Legionella maioricensis]